MKVETAILIISFILTVILGMLIIPILKKLKVGQVERNDGPQSHLKKQGTPTMGGIIIIATMILVLIGVCIYFSVNNQVEVAHKILPVFTINLGFG